MTGKDVFVFQEAVDDTHVTDLVGFRWIGVDGFTSVTSSTFLLNKRSQLRSVMHETVMLIQVGPVQKLFPLTEAAAKVRDRMGSARFPGWMKSTPAILLSPSSFVHYSIDRIRFLGQSQFLMDTCRRGIKTDTQFCDVKVLHVDLELSYVFVCITFKFFFNIFFCLNTHGL